MRKEGAVSGWAGRGLLLAAGVALLLTGCTLGGNPASRSKEMKAQRRQIMMKRSGMDKYLAGVDDTAPILFVATVNGRTQIHSIQPDGENVRQLTDEPGYKRRPAWNLQHTRIAYYLFPDDSPMSERLSIRIMNADGSEPRTVVADKKIEAQKIRMTWKPDGSVLYVREVDFPTIIYGYAVADGAQAETVRLPKNSFMTEAQSISPDMTYLAGAGPSKHDNIIHIGTIRRDGKSETDLMKPFKQIPFNLGSVVWAYDSQLVGFDLDKIIVVMSKSFSLNLEVYPLTPQDFTGELSSPAFSPSGTQLACIMEKTSEGQVGTGDQAVASDVWVMNVDGTKQRQITHTGTCFDPHW